MSAHRIAELLDFIERCLLPKADDRASTDDLLKHKFLKRASKLSALVPYIDAVREMKDKKKKTSGK